MAESVADERERFFSRIGENFSLKASLREDLEQLFILHTLQRYKSESLKRMRWVLSYFLVFAALQLFMFVLVQLLSRTD